MNWKGIELEPDARQVMTALDAPDCTWRAANVVAQETNLGQERVLEIVRNYEGRLTRISEMPAITGATLIGLIDRVGPAEAELPPDLHEAVQAAGQAGASRLEDLIRAAVAERMKEIMKGSQPGGGKPSGERTNT